MTSLIEEPKNAFKQDTWYLLQEQLEHSFPTIMKESPDLSGPLCYSLITNRYPLAAPLRQKVQNYLLNHQKTMPFKILINLISQTVHNNFGSSDFRKKFICLENMQRLAKLDDSISSYDIRVLVQALCVYIDLLGDQHRSRKGLLYKSSLQLVLTTLLKDIEKLDSQDQLKMDDLVSIIQYMSKFTQSKPLLYTQYSWKALLLKSMDKMSLENLEQLEEAIGSDF